MQQEFFYDYSNYGVYDRLTQDGLTQWHPAFLALGATLEICAAAYRKFCKRYKPKPKSERRNHWGSKLLAQIRARSRIKKKPSPGQTSLWEDWAIPAAEIRDVAKTFVLANCFDPEFTRMKFDGS